MEFQADQRLSPKQIDAAILVAKQVLQERKLAEGAYRALIELSGAEIIVSLEDRTHVYKRGQRGSPGLVPAVEIHLDAVSLRVSGHHLVR